MDQIQKTQAEHGVRLARMEEKDCPPPPPVAGAAANTAAEMEPGVTIQKGRISLGQIIAAAVAVITAVGSAAAWIWQYLGIHITTGPPK